MEREERKTFCIAAAKKKIEKIFLMELKSSLTMVKGSKNPYSVSSTADVTDSLCEICGKIEDYDAGNNRLLVTDGETSTELYVLKETIQNPEMKFRRGAEVVAIAVKVDDTFAAVSLVKEKDYARFDMFEDLPNRCRAMRDFFKLTPAQRANIKTQQAARKYAAYNPDKAQRFTEINEYWLKYLMCKESFLPETQGTIEELLTDARNPKSKAMMKLDYLLNSSPIDKDRKCIRFKELRSALDATIYKMDNVKEHITELLFSNQRSGIRGGNILLVGSAGMGKTTIALKVAQECGLNYDVISLNGMSTPLDWEGLDSSYDNSDVGKLTKCFRKAYTSEMLIVLDELDKMNMSKEGNPMNCLYSSLTGRHEDRFLETMLNTENVIFIATANSTDNIPEAILNRFSVIYMEDYSLEDKVRIAKDYTLPKLYAKFELQEEMICFEEAVLEYIIRNYCEDSGARDLERALEMVLRRVICDWDVDEAEKKVLVDKAYVRMALDGKISSDNPGIRLNRERDQYPEQVAKDIAQILSQKKEKKAGFNEQEKEKAEKRLEYLWVLKKTNKTSVFNPEIFRQQIDSTHYGMNKVKDAVTTFYYLQSLQGCMLNSNLAFVGGMGIGKSSICESIARAMGLTYCRISLNGMKDENVLKGFPPTYIGADAGIFMKEVKRAKTLRLLVQLDEIDKLQRELSHVLLDLLDRSFTDNFIGYPIDISEVVFIATANDWGNVDPLIRDRFTVIEVDGYTKEEKSEIIENYIIPKLESNFKDAGVSIELSKNGEQLLLDKYCTSFGIRDTQKALQKLVGEKLREQYGQAEAMKVDIQEEDVRRIMGQEPMPRGNFPTEKLAGVSKALAVTGNNYGNAFAIETVLIPGEATVEITGLPKESAIDSVKIAIAYIKRKYPQLLKDKGVHLHFSEGAVQKDGPSAGVAIMMSILSAALDKPIEGDISYTGEIDLFGLVFPIGGEMQKIQAAADCDRVYIPEENYRRLDREKLKAYNVKVIPVHHVSDVIRDVFPELEATG